MNRYLSAEFKRIFTKKSNIIAFLLMLGLVIGGNLLLHQGYRFNENAFKDNFERNGGIDSLVLMVGFAMALSASSWMVLFIGSFTMGDENKERAYLRVVESGISRWKIVVSKFILSALIAILFVFIFIVIHCILVAVFFGWNSLNTKMLLFFIQNFALLLIPLLAMLSILLLIYFTVKNELIVAVLFVFLAIRFSSIVGKLAIFAGNFKPIFLNISKYSPSGVFNKISENAYRIFIDESLKYQLDSSFVMELIPLIAVNILIIFAFIGISILVMNRRNLD